jgi:Mrp family chromosome partitioning ATPase
MFLNQNTVSLLKQLASQYDYVIVDTAPVMAADDVASLSPNVEGVVFVIRASCTSARVARAALDVLYQREVEVLGLVFNAVESNASDYYYYRYKDYYATSRSE